MSAEEEDLTQGIGNVQNPVLSRNLRNSLVSLDSWQHIENENDKEAEISALEEELANVNTQLETTSSKNIVLEKWQLAMIAGMIIALVAISIYIFKKVK